MNKKLEALFDMSPVPQSEDHAAEALPANRMALAALDEAIDKVEAALPQVRGLDATDTEMDELSDMAKTSYKDLMDLGMQVDSRFASEIFGVASNMLGHAITAKTAKLDKKLRMVDLQMKKMRLDQQQQAQDFKTAESGLAPTQTAEGMILSRNDLLNRILGKDQIAQKE